MDFEIRRLRAEDNKELAKIIRATLTEFGANKPGTVYFDESTDHLSDTFVLEKSCYFVCILNGQLVGGAGIYPTSGLPEHTCELVKMYLLPEARGKGLGKALINTCIQFAEQFKYNQVYLETMPELSTAIKVYEKMGFQSLPHALGNTGHFSCDIWMVKQLDNKQLHE